MFAAQRRRCVRRCNPNGHRQSSAGTTQCRAHREPKGSTTLGVESQWLGHCVKQAVTRRKGKLQRCQHQAESGRIEKSQEMLEHSCTVRAGVSLVPQTSSQQNTTFLHLPDSTLFSISPADWLPGSMLLKKCSSQAILKDRVLTTSGEQRVRFPTWAAAS